MAEPHVVSGLKAKQEEIRRQIRDIEKKLKNCRADLHTIADALRIFGDPQKYAKEDRLFDRGERARIIFDALREAPAPFYPGAGFGLGISWLVRRMPIGADIFLQHRAK